MNRTGLQDAERVHFIYLLCDNSKSMDTDVRRKGACRAAQAALEVFRICEGELQKEKGRKTTLRISAAWLNGGYLVKDLHPKDLQGMTEDTFRCAGETPLYRRSLAVLRDLMAAVDSARAEGTKARGHLIWFSDGEATDRGDAPAVAGLKELVASILNPKAANGEKNTQLFDLFAIPIGEKARAFYEEIGVPGGHIFDVPDALSESFATEFEAAAKRASLEAVLGQAEKKDVDDDDDFDDDEEAPGDIFLRLSKARKARKKISSIRLHWFPKLTD
jgi:hypothetical protein